jgi:protoheme IX farnesyltransferase
MLKYLQLTKPTIMLLIIITGATALVIEGSALNKPVDFMLILLGLALTGGSANAFNMYFERSIDAQMSRTRKRRPLPMGEIKPGRALAFAIVIGIIGVMIYLIRFNILSAVLALATIIYYAFFYTLVLKPHTVHNIVIGGAAGAMGPVISWAAVTGAINMAPFLLFLIIFLWSPPHFWALALFLKKDYELVGYPMLPIVKGDKAARNQILAYSVLLVASSFFLIITGAGLFYLMAALISGAILITRGYNLRKSLNNDMARGYFGFSIIYLFAIFVALIIDSFIKINLFI